MIKGIGIDIVDINRFDDLLTEPFLNRILSPKERLVYDAFKETNRKQTYLAGRFAVKEAYTKAVGTFHTPLNFKDVSVLNDASGKPYILTPYEPHVKAHVSLSHTATTVVAQVVLEDA